MSLDLGELGLENCEDAVDTAQEPRLGQMALAVALGHHGFDDLVAAGDELAERLRLVGRDRPRLVPDRLGEAGDDAWIDVSVLARRPVARAKSRIWRGLTTASGMPAAATTAAKPPVASNDQFD